MGKSGAFFFFFFPQQSQSQNWKDQTMKITVLTYGYLKKKKS